MMGFTLDILYLLRVLDTFIPIIHENQHLEMQEPANSSVDRRASRNEAVCSYHYILYGPPLFFFLHSEFHYILASVLY